MKFQPRNRTEDRLGKVPVANSRTAPQCFTHVPTEFPMVRYDGRRTTEYSGRYHMYDTYTEAQHDALMY